MVNKLVSTFVTGKEKAVAGAIVAFGVSFAAQHFGFHTSDAMQQTITSVVVAVVTHLAVYLERNTAVQKAEKIVVTAADPVLEVPAPIVSPTPEV